MTGLEAATATVAGTASSTLRTMSAQETGSARAAPKQLHGVVEPVATARARAPVNGTSRARAPMAPTLGAARRATATSSSTTGTARALGPGAGTPRAAKLV